MPILKTKKVLLSLFVSMSFTTMFIKFFYSPLPYQALISASAVLLLCLGLRRKFAHSIISLFFYFLLFCVLSSFAYLLQSKSLLGLFFVLLSFFHSLTVAYILNKEDLFSFIASLPFFTFCCWCAFLIANNCNPNDVFPESSRNVFSWIMLFGISIFYMTEYRKQSKFNPNIAPAFWCVLVSIWAMGRSGIASSILMLLGVILYNLKNRKQRKTYLTLLLLVMTAISSFVWLYRGELVTEAFFRFKTQKITEDARKDITRNYILNTSNLKNFLSGFNIVENEYMHQWKFNLHNSYLVFHSVMGLGSVFFIILLFSGVIKKGRECFLFVFIGLSLALRIATDSGALPGPIDPALFYFYFKSSP